MDQRDLDGIRRRRIFAYIVDFGLVIGLTLAFWAVVGVLGVLTFGLAWGLFAFAPFIGFAYHVLLIGGRHHATLGMRLLDVEVRTWNSGAPGYLQAAVQTALFYLSLSFIALPLLWSLFDDRKRCLHDLLSGCVVVRRTST